jgi:hypothetical protein
VAEVKPNRLGAPAIVVVPEDELAGEHWREDHATSPDDRGSPPAATAVDPHTSPNDRLRQSSEINGLVRLLTAAHERADKTEVDLRIEREAREAVQAELAAEKDARAKAEGKTEAAEQALAGERARANALGAKLEQSETRARTAEGEASALRQAEAERKGRGRLRRVLAAWRGE